MHLARIVVQAKSAIDVDPDKARALLHQATAVLAGQIARLEEQPATGRLAPWQVRRIVRFIDENIGRRLQVREVAAAVRLSPGYFSRAFRDSFGISARSYIIARRIERAQRLMLETEESLVHIAGACGFADQAHLSRTFHHLVGDTPRGWRRSMAMALGPASAAGPDECAQSEGQGTLGESPPATLAGLAPSSNAPRA